MPKPHKFTSTLIVTIVCLALSTIAHGQTFTTLLSFNGTDGTGGASVVQGFDGNFYGTGAV